MKQYELDHIAEGPRWREEMKALRGEPYFGEYFDSTVLLLIVVNTLFLAMEDPTSDGDDKKLFKISEFFFNSIFTVEMLLKWFAMGVVSFDTKQLAFMSERWNQLDFLVVLIGWMPQILVLLLNAKTSANFTAIRTLRVLKVLKTFQRVKGMQKIVSSLFSCYDILVNVLQLMIFMYFVFAIIGVQVFKGGLRRRCVSFEGNGYVKDEDCGSSWAPCTCNTNSEDMGFQCSQYKDSGYDLVCSYKDPTSQSGNVKYFGNPGELSFDNVFIGFLTVLTCASLEGWVDIMYHYMDSFGPLTVIYFIIMIPLLAFFVLNLVIAVIYEAFSSYGTEENIVTGRVAVSFNDRMWRAGLDESQIAYDNSPLQLARSLITPQRYSWRDGSEYCHPLRSQTKLDKVWYTFAALRDACEQIVATAAFNYVINILICLNTLVLAMEHEGQSCFFTVTLCQMNIFFTFSFALEMVLKLLGIGLQNYLSDGFNIFDGVIVIFSVGEVLLFSNASICNEYTLCEASVVTTGKSIQVLRALRLLRVTRAIKMVKRWKSMALIVNAIAESASGLVNFCSLLLLFMIIYALFGMQLFAGKTAMNENFYNFNDLYRSLLTVFVVTTGENWNDTLYATMASYTEPFAGAAYTSSMYIFGNYIVVNIFLAILLNNFDQASGDGEEGNLYSELSKTNEATKFARFFARHIKKCIQWLLKVSIGETPASSQRQITADEHDVQLQQDAENRGSGHRARKINRISSVVFNTDVFIDEVMEVLESKLNVNMFRRGPGGSKVFYNCFRAVDLVDCLVDEGMARNVEDALQISHRLTELHLIDRKFPLITVEPDMYKMNFSDDSSLYGFSDTSRHRLFLLGLDDGGAIRNGERMTKHDELVKKRIAMAEGTSFGMSGRHPFRRVLIKVVTHPLFDSCVLILIILSSIALAVDEPRKTDAPKSEKEYILEYGDYVMTVLFFFEMVSKMLAQGLVGDQRCYLHDAWNVLDFFIVCVSIITMSLKLRYQGRADSFTFLKSLRIARVLRPLRMINRYPGMKMVVNALFAAMPEVANVGLVSLGFFVGFAIMGLALFRGQLNFCDGDEDDVYLSEIDCIGTYIVNGRSHDREWRTNTANFDNIGSSLLTLFEMATLEGWPSMMSAGMQASPDGRREKIQAANALFYVAFVIVGAFLVINLFVGVVVNKFQEAKANQDDPTQSLFLTPDQQRWRDEMVSILRYKVPHVMVEPEFLREVRLPFFKLVESKLFEKFIMGVILLNVGSISLVHWRSGPEYLILTEWLNFCFTLIFAMEMIFKVIGLSFKQYWKSAWNQFDFWIVLLSFLDLTLPFSDTEGAGLIPINMSLFRVLRVARIAKLIKSSVGLKALMSTMIKSFPSLINVTSLLGLLFFIYAVMGMNLFGSYDVDPNDGTREIRKC